MESHKDRGRVTKRVIEKKSVKTEKRKTGGNMMKRWVRFSSGGGGAMTMQEDTGHEGNWYEVRIQRITESRVRNSFSFHYDAKT